MISQTQAAIISIAVIIPLSSFAVLNSAKSSGPIEPAEESLEVVTSFYPLYEFTRQVGGDKVEVSILVPSGVEPHDWEPTIQDLQHLQHVDLVVINGIGFEDWIDKIELLNAEVILVDTSKGISILGENGGHVDDFVDSHIWLNPNIAKIQVNNIAEALTKINPQNKNYYLTNAKSYNEQLDELDRKIRASLEGCQKDFIVFHGAFSHFANEYGLNQHTVIDSSEPHDEPTSRSLQNIITLAKNFNIKIIFTEEAIDPRITQVIANEINGKVLTLSPLETVSYEDSYIDLMEQNLSNLKEALCN